MLYSNNMEKRMNDISSYLPPWSFWVIQQPGLKDFESGGELILRAYEW